MKTGCFGKISQIEDISRAGYQCAELDICEIAALSDGDFQRLVRRTEDSGLDYGVFSGLFPAEIRIYEDCFKQDKWLEHVRRSADRIACLGAEIVPFGAGKGRSIPEDAGAEEQKKCEEKLLEFIRGICDIFAQYHIRLAIEPLGACYSNYLNLIRDADAFSIRVQRENCRIMCDLRHMVSNQDELEEIRLYAEHIIHAHIDFPLGDKRYFPVAEDGYDYMPYLETLKKAGYDGRLTVEATEYRDFIKEAEAGQKYLESLLVRIEEKNLQKNS